MNFSEDEVGSNVHSCYWEGTSREGDTDSRDTETQRGRYRDQGYRDSQREKEVEGRKSRGCLVDCCRKVQDSCRVVTLWSLTAVPLLHHLGLTSNSQ